MGAPTTQETEAAIVNRKCTTHIYSYVATCICCNATELPYKKIFVGCK